MAKSTKSKMIVREIKKDIKITEINKEEIQEAEQPAEESSLEDLTINAPSARSFPQFSQPARAQQINAEEETPSEKTDKTENQGAVYNVQNVTESDIRRSYESPRSEADSSRGIIRNPMLMSAREARGSPLQNTELQAMRDQQNQGNEADRYEVSTGAAHQTSKRKYPWET